jgi:hypothetical protein
MTADELEQIIVDIRKRGLPKLLEFELIGKARGEYYEERINILNSQISERFFNNVDFLSRMHRSFPSATNIKEYMGYQVDNYYSNMMSANKLFSIKQAIVVSKYYGIPIELLLFQDLELYGERIRKDYPTFFKQS